MAEHTPGPWTVDERRKEPGIDLHIDGAHGEKVLHFMAFGKSKGRTRANARLIAAAPDMLKALQEVAHHADDECGFMVDVRAAIARATSD